MWEEDAKQRVLKSNGGRAVYTLVFYHFFQVAIPVR
jgi:hypothetical protein